MTSTISFGRRHAPLPLARTAFEAADPDERFEALRRDMARVRGEDSDFRGWRRDQQLGRWVSWFASFALLMPGVICFMAHAPQAVSGVLEVAGIAGGWWLRRQRKQRLNAIREWRSDEFA